QLDFDHLSVDDDTLQQSLDHRCPATTRTAGPAPRRHAHPLACELAAVPARHVALDGVGRTLSRDPRATPDDRELLLQHTDGDDRLHEPLRSEIPPGPLPFTRRRDVPWAKQDL